MREMLSLGCEFVDCWEAANCWMESGPILPRAPAQTCARTAVVPCSTYSMMTTTLMMTAADPINPQRHRT